MSFLGKKKEDDKMPEPAKSTPSASTAPTSITSTPVVTKPTGPAPAAPKEMTLPGGRKIKVLKAVTLPLLKQHETEAVYVRFETPFTEGKKLEGDKAAAFLANVINIETGEEMEYIVNAVLRGQLTDKYPNNGYVGKCFAIMKFPKQEGKRYNAFSIKEIEVEGL